LEAAEAAALTWAAAAELAALYMTAIIQQYQDKVFHFQLAEVV
jgi:hypothetical protein